MNFYLKLQFKIIYRKIKAFGVPPIIGFFIIPLFLFYISNLLMERYEHGVLIVVLLQISALLKLSNSKKINFLKIHFCNIKVFKIRFLENIIISIFFSGFLLYKAAYLEAFLSLLISILFTVIITSNISNWVLPTPFKGQRYEFSIYFRKKGYLLPILSYLLASISLYVGNFNLGIFSLILIGLFCIAVHSKTEKPFYVWIYNLSPRGFLKEKIKFCLQSALVFSIPNLIMLLCTDYTKIDLVLLALLYVGIINIAYVFLKYSKYPKEINLADGITFLVSSIVVPFFIILIPMHYNNSVNHLKAYLNDPN